MTLPLNEKLQRMLPFLVASRHPRIFVQLAQRGYTADDLAEGWRLFTSAAGANLRFEESESALLPGDPATALLAELDALENTWFPVAKATLERRYPDLAAAVFDNLSQTEGYEVMVSVGTFLDRLDAIAADPQGAEALALLARRGLTPEARAEARALIGRIQAAAEPSLPVIDPTSREEQDAAVAAAWAWYREWSQIARTVVTRNDMLVRLGLRRRSTGRSPAAPPDAEPDALAEPDEA